MLEELCFAEPEVRRLEELERVEDLDSPPEPDDELAEESARLDDRELSLARAEERDRLDELSLDAEALDRVVVPDLGAARSTGLELLRDEVVERLSGAVERLLVAGGREVLGRALVAVRPRSELPAEVLEPRG